MNNLSLHTSVLEMCQTCVLNSTKRKFVPPEGNLDAKICLVGQSPGRQEFFRGRPFIGPSGELIGRYFIEIFDQMSISTFSEFLNLRSSFLYITNACLCDVLTPVTKVKKTYCYDRLHAELNRVNPSLIIAFGALAVEYLTRGEIETIGNVRGYLLKVGDYFVYPMLHPSAVLKQQENQWLFESDMKKLRRIIHGGYIEPEVTTFQINTLGALKHLTEQVEELPEDALLSFDLETTELNPFKGSIICLSVSFKDFVGYVIPMDDPIVIPYVKRILGSRCRKVAQNCKFDLLFLRRNGILVKNMYFDTMLGQHVINENLPSNLTTLTSFYLDYPKYDLKLEKYKKEHSIKNYGEIPVEVLYPYAAHDAIVTRAIAKKLIPQITKHYEHVYWEVEFPAQLAFVDVELSGILVDKGKVDQLTKKVVDEIKVAETELFRLTGGSEFNYKSSRQLVEVLYSGFNLPVVRYTPKGAISMDAASLAKLQSVTKANSKERLVIESLMSLRKRHKVLSTYLSGGQGGIWRYVEKDSRVHPDFKVNGTVTGRVSAVEPPIQTIPKSAVRSIFTVPQGYKFVEADLSAAELYSLAWYAGCKTMLDQLNSGMDFHIQTAERIFKKEVKKSDIERRLAKFAVYGIIYGRGKHSLAEQFKLRLDEADNILNSLFEVYPEIHDFLIRVVEQAKTERILTNIFGRTS